MTNSAVDNQTITLAVTGGTGFIARGVYDAMYPGDPNGRVKLGVADGDPVRLGNGPKGVMVAEIKVED